MTFVERLSATVLSAFGFTPEKPNRHLTSEERQKVREGLNTISGWMGSRWRSVLPEEDGRWSLTDLDGRKHTENTYDQAIVFGRQYACVAQYDERSRRH
jgi:hypothetical protein